MSVQREKKYCSQNVYPLKRKSSVGKYIKVRGADYLFLNGLGIPVAGGIVGTTPSEKLTFGDHPGQFLGQVTPPRKGGYAHPHSQWSQPPFLQLVLVKLNAYILLKMFVSFEWFRFKLTNQRPSVFVSFQVIIQAIHIRDGILCGNCKIKAK